MLLPLLEDGYDMRTVQEPLGHKDVQTTPNYTDVLNRGECGFHGPVERLWKRVCVGTLCAKINETPFRPEFSVEGPAIGEIVAV